MKREERIAQLFLTKRFGKEPVYEPLGKSLPPDFSVDRTAFEVRRLNQQFSKSNGTLEGLEEVSYPLEKAVHGELAKIPFSPEIGSCLVSLSFERPLRSSASKTARKIAQQARASYSAGSRNYTIIVDGVTVEIIPATNSYTKAFLPGLINDWDSAGWVGEIYVKGIQLALQEKISKSERVVQKFDSWVLVLVDTIMPDTEWLNDIGSLTLDLHHFHGIAVLTPKGSLTLEWPSNSLSNIVDQ